ncbi:hypothetical protein DFJ74DRAFT_712750 [Hyaloraphidium curvatum]|nr:hypothetical protein DFJ74DRAFT_712750 [Hyaloraphidium curvatum]
MRVLVTPVLLPLLLLSLLYATSAQPSSLLVAVPTDAPPAPTLLQPSPPGGPRPSKTAATVRVVGQATATAAPDRAVVEIAIETRDTSAPAAATNNAVQAAIVVAAVNATLSSAERSSIETGAFYLYPNYNYSGSGLPIVVGFQVTQLLTVTIDATGAELGRLASAVADAAIRTEASSSVRSTDFALRDPEALRARALAAAASVGVANAKAIAGALGKGVVDVVSVEEPTAAPAAVPTYKEAPMAGAMPASDSSSPEIGTRIVPGSIKAAAQVIVTATVA